MMDEVSDLILKVDKVIPASPDEEDRMWAVIMAAGDAFELLSGRSRASREYLEAFKYAKRLVEYHSNAPAGYAQQADALSKIASVRWKMGDHAGALADQTNASIQWKLALRVLSTEKLLRDAFEISERTLQQYRAMSIKG